MTMSSQITEISSDYLNRLLDISNNLLSSLYHFDRSKVWDTVTSQIQSFFDCELASLFLVDDNDSESLRLESRSPHDLNRKEVKLRIQSMHGAGLTSHAANSGETILIGKEDLTTNKYLRPEFPDYLPSQKFYSALYAPLTNRKGNLVALLRLHNKNISRPSDQSAFTQTDKSAIQILGSQLVAILENAHASDALRQIIDEIHNSKTTSEAVDHILHRGTRLLHADFGFLYLWSSTEKKLVLAGSRSRRPSILLQPQELSDSCTVQVYWNAITGDLEDDQDSGKVRINFNPNADLDLSKCHSNAKSTISVPIYAHGEAIGLIHFEAFITNGFDISDTQALQALARNITTAIETSRSLLPGQILEDRADRRVPSLWQVQGISESVVNTIPIVMWRKDMNGRFQWINDAFCKSVSLSYSEIIGKSDLELFGDFDAPMAQRFEAGDRKAIENGWYEDPEEEFLRKNGNSAQFVHVIRMPLLNSKGEIIGTQGLYQDVTNDPHRHLFKSAPVAFLEIDENAKIRRINEHLEVHLLGYKSGQLYGTDFSLIIGGSGAIQAMLEQPADDNAPGSKWHPIYLKKSPESGGAAIPALLSGLKISGRNRGAFSALCTVREMSAGAEVEATLRHPDSRYLEHIKRLEIPVFCVDRDLLTTFVNKAHLDRNPHLTYEGCLGKRSSDLYGHDLGQRYDSENQDVLETGQPLDLIEPHGQQLVRVLKFPILDVKGAVIGVQGIYWNYKEHEHAKEQLSKALIAAMHEYRDIVQSASEAIYEASNYTQIVSANPAMVALLGYNSELELVADRGSGTSRFADADAQMRYYNTIIQTRNTQNTSHVYRLVRRDGNIIWVSESVQMRGTPERPGNYVGFIKDITATHQHDENREHMLKMLSHQLKSPVWQSYDKINKAVHSEDSDGLLLEGRGSESARRLAVVRGLVRKTYSVAYNIQAISTLAESDRLTHFSRRWIPSRRLVKIARECARDHQLMHRSADVFLQRIGSQSEVPDFKVDEEFLYFGNGKIYANADLIEQCVSNLIENAYKYSRSSSVINISIANSYETVILSIRNQPVRGLEIDAITKSQCKKRGWRSKGAIASDADGAGIGLWFVDRVMDAHGGILRVTETDSNGWNCFALEFPQRPH